MPGEEHYYFDENGELQWEIEVGGHLITSGRHFSWESSPQSDVVILPEDNWHALSTHTEPTEGGQKAPQQKTVLLREFHDNETGLIVPLPRRIAFETFSPRDFQNFVAERLERMGFEVALCGDVNTPDGGVDMFAVPKNFAVPFVMAVQVKHHKHPEIVTGVRDVRDFHGVLTAQHMPVQLGMIVTNTGFSRTAKWFASQNQALLRLRGFEDVQRWIRDEFISQEELRELPREIELYPGLRVKIPGPDSLRCR